MASRVISDSPLTMLFGSEPLIGGMNSRIAPESIREDQVAELLNADLDDPSQPKKREGYSSTIIGSFGMANQDLRIAALSELNLGPGVRLMVAVAPGEDGGVYVTTTPSASAWSEATLPDGSSLNVGTEAVTVGRGHDALWVMPQSAMNAHAVKASGEIVDCGDENGSPPREVVAMAYGLGRAFPITRNKVFFSKVFPSADDLEEKTAFNRSVDFIAMEPGASGSYVGGTFWRDQSLIVFGDERIDRIVVDPADPLDSALHVVEPRFGCSAPKTIAAVGDTLYFLDQFLELRELRQTIQASVAGVAQDPVSEPIRSELSLNGRINSQHANKSFVVVRDERLLLFYPRDNSIDPNAVAVWNTRLRAWEGVWLLAHPMSDGMVSSIDGYARLYTSNGDSDDPTAKVYQWGGVYGDDGEPIAYRETTRAMTGESPLSIFTPHKVAYSVFGGVGAVADVSIRTSHNGSLSRISRATVEASESSSFPLVDPDDFPLVDPDDFPLVDSTPQVSDQNTTIYQASVGDGPLYKGLWPLYSMDFPLFDAGYGAEPGRFLQVRIEETSTKPFVRKSYALVAHLTDETPDTHYAGNAY